MTLQEFGLLLFSVVTAACGQLMLKTGALKITSIEASGALERMMAVATIPQLIIGLGFYGLSAVTYILLLSRVKLSIAAPSTALIYVFSVLIGIFIFKEPVSAMRLVGIGFIACGVILVISQ